MHSLLLISQIHDKLNPNPNYKLHSENYKRANEDYRFLAIVSAQFASKDFVASARNQQRVIISENVDMI